MARDDYFVMAYWILDYLYQCFKAGEAPDTSLFGPDALGIRNAYWCNILESLYKEGYICGIEIVPRIGAPAGIKLIDLKITEKGIRDHIRVISLSNGMDPFKQNRLYPVVPINIDNIFP